MTPTRVSPKFAISIAALVPALRSGLVGVFLLVGASPATAQWTRVNEVPEPVEHVWVKGDTIAACVDTAIFLSTDGGVSWRRSPAIATSENPVQVVRVHNGRIYAGTYGLGVFVSEDLGDTWVAFNQGLAGGIFNTHLFIKDLLVHDGQLLAATAGAGPYVRTLDTPGTWSHNSNVFEPNQASNMNTITAGATRRFACAGANGTVFFRDPAHADWTLSWLNNVGPVPGLAALNAIATGTRWVVATNAGVFTSEHGQSPWTFSDSGLGLVFTASFMTRGPELLGCFGVGGGTTIATSPDDGATWNVIDDLPAVFTFNAALHGNTLYTARFDGLWRRSLETVSVPPGPDTAGLGFAIAGQNPVRGDVRFRFALSEASAAVIEVFDLAGRRCGERLDAALAAGLHEVAWNARSLEPGVYLARLMVAGRSETARFVRVR